MHDDCLGRTLDRFYDYNPTGWFAEIARHARQRVGIAARQVPLDTTSFSVSGEYAPDTPEALRAWARYRGRCCRMRRLRAAVWRGGKQQGGQLGHRGETLRLVGAVLAEQHDEWQVSRRCFSEAPAKLTGEVTAQLTPHGPACLPGGNENHQTVCTPVPGHLRTSIDGPWHAAVATSSAHSGAVSRSA